MKVPAIPARDEAGRPSGLMLIARVIPALSVGVIISNLVGAVILFALASWVIPVPQVENDTTIRIVNLVALAIYVLCAVIVAVARTFKDVGVVRRWLLADRPPTFHEQSLALRTPIRLFVRLLWSWGLGIVIFTILNASFEPRLALVVAIAGMFAALGTCAFSYLVAERAMRQIARRALEDGPREHPAVLGVTTRVMLIWALSTGGPVLGVVLIVAGVVLGILPDDSAKQQLATMVICGVALSVGMTAMYMVSRSISDPVKSVRQGLERVGDGDLAVEVPIYDASELGQLQRGFNDMVEGLRERERVRDLFGRHVGEEVAEQAMLVGSELGGELRDVAAVFIDVVGSTEFAATRPPTEVVELLNRFFAVVVAVVAEHGGSVNKFEGDAALCIFGAPGEREDASGDALAASREMATRLAAEVPDLGIGIGVSAGPVVAGNVGAAERHEYTVIGDPVNEAARLTEIAKTIEGGVVASGAVIERASEAESSRWRHEGSVVLRGRNEKTLLSVPA